MPRIPTSFYLNILAGILVLFNHYASSETGDVALNKVTGAADRFYTLFRDTAVAFQHSCNSHLETVLCGPTLNSILPRDVIEPFRVRYCPAPMQDSESTDGTSNKRQPPGGYGSSDVAFVYYKSPIRPLPRIPAKNFVGRPLFGLELTQGRLSRATWDGSREAVMTIGLLLLRTCASWWWFRAPFKVAGVVLVAFSGLSMLGYLFGENPTLRCISQASTIAVADFLRCIEWEAQRLAPDMAVIVMEQADYALQHARKRV